MYTMCAGMSSTTVFSCTDIAKQKSNHYGWDTLEKRAIKRIGQSGTAAFITKAEFTHVKSISEAAECMTLLKAYFFTHLNSDSRGRSMGVKFNFAHGVGDGVGGCD